MGKKKRGHPDIAEILARPWCYYCERDFDDLKILINHQKARHFKCERCGRRLNTAGGLSVHMTQVHKETLTTIDNALPNRSGLDVEIFGMEGIPEDIVQSHNQRVIGQFAQAEAERRAATGNPGPGASGGNGVKKPKFESPADLKKRLAEHKAKVAMEQAAGGSSGDVTPMGAGFGNMSPGPGQSPGVYQAGSPGYQQGPMSYGPPQNNQSIQNFPQQYGQQSAPYQQQPSPFPQQSPGFGPPLGGAQFSNSQLFAPPQQFQPPVAQQFPPQAQQFPPQSQQYPPQGQHFPQSQPFPPQGQHFPPPAQQFPPQVQQFPPQSQQFPPQGQQFSPPSQQFQPPFQNGPPRYGANSPPASQQGPYQPPRTHSPPQNGAVLPRIGSLPSAPGLPQRPSFGAPPVNAFQMQQLHQGQIPAPPTQAPFTNHQGHPQQHRGSFDNHHDDRKPQDFGVVGYGYNDTQNHTPREESHRGPSTNATSLEDLVSGAANDADRKAEKSAELKAEDLSKADQPKKGKKDKEKATRMVYSDQETSPEEKMARLPRYAFAPKGEETVLVDATTASGVTGIVTGPDDVIDRQG